MPVYINPDFQRPAGGLARLFDRATGDSFFALPAWYDLMARYGVPAGSEIRVYTDERPGSATALLLRTGPPERKRCLTSLANAYSVEHGVISLPGADLEAGFTAVFSEILRERPRWECLCLTELDPH